MKLSIEKLKELLPNSVLDRRGKYLKANCPVCGFESFTISTENNHLSGCNRKNKCGVVFNLYTLAKLLGKTSLLNIEGEVGTVEKLENKLFVKEAEIDLKLPKITMPTGWKRIYQHDYLDSRGFIEYNRYKVGITNIDPRFKNNYVIFCLEEEGEIKGYIGRHIWSKEKIEEENERRKKIGLKEILRYINSGTDFSKLLMGYEEIVTGVTKTIICVEGAFDKFNVDKILGLHNQEEIKCNATFKCHISDEQIIKWKLKGVETLILFYDPDVIKQIKEVAVLVDLHFKVLIAFNDQGDDAGDITAQQLAKVINNLKTVSEFSINKINEKNLKY